LFSAWFLTSGLRAHNLYLYTSKLGPSSGQGSRHVACNSRPSDRPGERPRSCVSRSFCKKILELRSFCKKKPRYFAKKSLNLGHVAKKSSNFLGILDLAFPSHFEKKVLELRTFCQKNPLTSLEYNPPSFSSLKNFLRNTLEYYLNYVTIRFIHYFYTSDTIHTIRLPRHIRTKTCPT